MESKLPRTINQLLDIASKAAREAYKLEHGAAPIADAFDPETYPYGVKAGANKGNFMNCSTCNKPPTITQLASVPVFLFKDALSAREYEISGMCQACQDRTFRED